VARVRRASSRGPRDAVSWCALARARWPRIAGRSRGPEQQRQGRRSRHADLGPSRTEPGLAESERSAGFAIATSLGLWVRFSDWSEEGQTVWSSRRVEGGKRGQRSAAGEVERDRRELALGGGVGRGRVAAVEDRGRRAGTETGMGSGSGRTRTVNSGREE